MNNNITITDEARKLLQEEFKKDTDEFLKNGELLLSMEIAEEVLGKNSLKFYASAFNRCLKEFKQKYGRSADIVINENWRIAKRAISLKNRVLKR